MTLQAMTEPDIGNPPVLIAVWSVALTAGFRVVEPGHVDLGIRPRLPERVRDPLRPPGLDGISAPSVRCGNSFEQQLQPSGIPAALEGPSALVLLLIPVSRQLVGRHQLDAVRR
jgi:hypothetical protein